MTVTYKGSNARNGAIVFVCIILS